MKRAKKRPFLDEPEFWKVLKKVDTYPKDHRIDWIDDEMAGLHLVEQLTDELDREIIEQLKIEVSRLHLTQQ